MKNYSSLEGLMHRLFCIDNALSIIQWDASTNMPLKSGESRGEEIAQLSAISHKMFTDKSTADLINGAKEETAQLSEWQKRNLELIAKEYELETALDESLVINLAKQTSKTELLWREARAESNFKKLQPELEKLLTFVREAATIKSVILGRSKYEALLDQYDPDRKTSQIDNIFAILKQELPSLITKARANSRKVTLQGTYPKEKQKALGLKLMESMGFDFTQGRLDESTHPFCGGTRYDIRMTTRYDEKNPISGLMGIIHETGHALYEMNRPNECPSQLVSKGLGMALHESQSLIMEMQAGCSREFSSFLAPKFKEYLSLDISAEDLFETLTYVEPGYIRVDADEVTYPMHVILRYEIEQDLIEGRIEVADIPSLWNSKMKEYLDVEVKEDRLGCLQDIHWPSGGFGYFPTYSLGAMTAAQLMHSAKVKFPDIPQQLSRGDFSHLNLYLNDAIRSKGRLYDFSNLIIKATGSDLDPKFFLNHLKERYI